jgi:indolepyruvate ferredoxin oxidoreductase alpha subunit
MPVQKIKDFAAKVDRLVVIEELDPFIEEHCKAIGVEVEGKDIFPMIGEFSQNMIAQKLGGEAAEGKKLEDEIPLRPPVMCPGCPHRGLFYTLKKNSCNVLGDIGCYTLGAVAPLNSMDSTLCMGASISGLHGFNKALGEAGEKKSVAVIGDSTFMHSGMTGLANIAYNQSNSTVVILDNSITGMTGHQQNPTTGYNIKGEPAGKIDLEALCKAMGINRVTVVDPYNLKECNKVLKEELAAEEPSVIISRRPCVLLKSVKPQPALRINPSKCSGCKSCMRIGCPSISFKNGVCVVDHTTCVGCGVCQQLCGHKAFEETV